MSTWAWLITKPEMVRGRAVSSDSGAPREDRIDAPGELLVPAVKYRLMQRMAALVEDSNDAIISVAGEGYSRQLEPSRGIHLRIYRAGNDWATDLPARLRR